ncbi:hypothetical protein [Amycolatopsis sp. NPDC006125]|uniref:hypothetical protein n=1 Tax=Amycolatopsis sp. NPDC006125 TaxID=3156730 RepID=UPI0033BD6B1D
MTTSDQAAKINRAFPELASTPDQMKPFMQEHHGVWVCYIGEDGDVIALGHHEPRRVLAAFNRIARKECGLVNLVDDRNARYVEVARELHWRMARLVTACEAPEHDQDIEERGYCYHCVSLKDGGFWVDWSDPEHPDAFPITTWEA